MTKTNAKISVILFADEKSLDNTNFLNPWLLQDYNNFDLHIITNPEKTSCSLFKKIERRYKNAKIISQSEPNPLDEILNIESDYVIYADGNDFYPINYISSMVAVINDADMCISSSAVLFPDNKDNLLNKSIGFTFNSNTACGDEFFLNYSTFWGTYFLGNKLIKTSLLKKIVNERKKYIPIFSYKENLYSYHLLYSALAFAECKKVNICRDAMVVVDWSYYDNKAKAIKSIYIKSLKNISNIFNIIERKFNHSDADSSKLNAFKTSFISRYWWRTSWIFENEHISEITNSISEYFNYINFDYKNDFTNSVCEISTPKLEKEMYFPIETANADKNKNINIYVSMHKPSFVPDIKCLKPIQVGTALADERFSDVIHDDEGDNISTKNKRYCELTAQYWAWKNDTDADYYGFWHYRRYFCFNREKKADMWGNVDVPTINDKILKDLHIDMEHISEATELYDIIIPEEWTCNEGNGEMTVYQHWCKHFNQDDIQTLCDVIHEKYPEYDKSVMNLLFSNNAPFCNLFIMRKDLFNEYSEFCFSVLNEVEKRVDHENYNVERYRTMGHLAERMVGIFVNHIERTRQDINVLRLPTVLIRDTRPKATISPIKTDKKSVVVALACDNKFVPITSVLLQSIHDNSSNENFYDIVLMHKDISQVNQNKLSSIFWDTDNISLRFADVSKNFENHLNLHVDRHLSIETYFRFIIPDIMSEYEKVLYLDCDMVAVKDISDLYFTDIGNYALAATRDLDFIASYQKSERKKMYDEEIIKYMNLENVEDYFQAGVILFNLKKIASLYTVDDLFERALVRNWYYHDQDILNSMFTGDVYYLNQKWNVLTMLEPNSERSNLFKEFLYARYSEAYNKARKNIGIIHFAGVPKPWFDPKCDLSMYFWRFARKSPFYEELLNKLNSGNMLPFGSVVFTSNHIVSDNAGCELFEIIPNKNKWSECYAVVDFIFLSEHNRTELTKTTLYISASVIPKNDNQLEIKMNCFKFDNCDYDYIFKDNIKYQISGNSIIIKARQTGKYEGFSWRIRELQSREIEKPTIKILNDGFIDNVVHL